jgi:hypothetical protein
MSWVCKWKGDTPPNAEVRACADCYHQKGYVTWWCTNEQAVERHKSSLPIRKGCPFWKPMEKYSLVDKLNVYVIDVDLGKK